MGHSTEKHRHGGEVQLNSDTLLFDFTTDSKGHLTATIRSKIQMGPVRGQKANGHASKGKSLDKITTQFLQENISNCG